MSSTSSIYDNSNISLNNWIDETNSTEFSITEHHAVQAVFCVLYITIFVMGIVGNVLVCYVVCRNKAMQTVTNLFITNLALADILLSVLAVPFTPTYTFLSRWVFGNVLCHIVPYAQGCSIYISTLTLTSIAIDRFFVIIYPFRPRMLLSTSIFIILGIWVFSLLVTLPYGMYMNTVSIRNASITGTDELIQLCEENWPTEHMRKAFGAMTTTLQFLLPFLIITFCYVCVSIRLNSRSRARPGNKNTKKEEVDRDRKRRTNRMLIAMVTIFGVSWLPLNAINMINDFFHHTAQWKYSHLCFFMAHSLAMASTCYNPFLYAWLNENFRKEFKQVLPCFKRRSGDERLNNWRSERTGNETMQESLLTSFVRRTSESPVVVECMTVPSGLIDNFQGKMDGKANGSKNEMVTMQLISVDPAHMTTEFTNEHIL